MLKKRKRSLKARLISAVTLALIIFLLVLFADHAQWVERYYAEGVYPVICRLLHPLLNLFPFSVGDVLYILVIAYLVYAFVHLIALAIKKEFRRAGQFLLGIVIGVETGILVFYLFWGMNYFRPPAGERLNLRDSSYTTPDLETVTAILIDSANACRARVTPVDLMQNNKDIFQTAIQAVSKLSGSSTNFHTYDPKVKPSILTPLLNYLGTSGYYNPFTSEAQINYQMPVFDRPFVACHEMSHQMGYGAEDEANFVGFLAGTGSHDRLLRYSAYQAAVGEFMRALYFRDSLCNKELRPRISAAVHNDFKAERAYWRSYQNKAGILSGIFYDKFLKANNQPQGIDTYNRMVQLIMALYRKERSPWSMVHSP